MFIFRDQSDQVCYIVHRSNFEWHARLDWEILDDSVRDESVLSVQSEAIPQLLSEFLVIVVEHEFEDVTQGFDEDCLDVLFSQSWLCSSVPLE